tara:strand:+ start:4643 stop:5323 length:681 start_codon:yes stop_codon:yes gene_type:complete
MSDSEKQSDNKPNENVFDQGAGEGDENKLSSLPPPIPDGEDKYVVLQETNAKEVESWYYFLKWNGNEENLKYLGEQLDKIDMFLIDDCSTFDLDLDHFFCERTAKEMIMLEVNTLFHRKFDGEVGIINLGLKKRDSNEDMIYKVFEKIGMGQIEDYANDEDIPDDGNLCSGSESGSESDSDSDDDLVPAPRKTGKQSNCLPKGVKQNNKKKNKKNKNRREVFKKNK